MVTYSHLEHQQTDGVVLKPIPLTETLMLDSPLMEQACHVGCVLHSLSLSLHCARVAPGYTSTCQPPRASRPNTGQSLTKVH
jgi:hypothetical protein